MNVLIVVNGVVVNCICATDLATAQTVNPGALCLDASLFPGVGPMCTTSDGGKTFQQPPAAPVGP